MKVLLGWMVWVFLIAWVVRAENPEVSLDDASMKRSEVKTQGLVSLQFGEQMRMVGQVVSEPGSTFVVKSVLPGRVDEILVSPGDEVKTGDVLLRFHSHEFLDMQGQMLQAHHQLKMTEKRLEAGKELYEVKAIARVELENREQAALAARLYFERTRSELIDFGCVSEEIERILEGQRPSGHMQVRAPSSGAVLSVEVQVHEWVDALTPMFSLGDPTRLELQLQIPPERLASILPGDAVEFFPLDRPSIKARGTVISKVPKVDPETRTVAVRVKIDQASPSLYPGLFVQGRILGESMKTVPAIPESAVIRLGEHDVVFVKKSTNRFEARPVELGRFEGGLFEVVSGVDSADQVVVNGTFLLKSALVQAQAEEE